MSILTEGDDEEFEARLLTWLIKSPVRLVKIKDAEASAAAAANPGRLVPLTIELYCKVLFHDWELVYVDDADGARIPVEYEQRVRELDVPLNVGRRWPDIILR